MKRTIRKNCPCCSHQLLRHIRNQEVYLFCRRCWQEMPDLNRRQCGFSLDIIKEEFPRMLEKAETIKTAISLNQR
jgi:hypothetical protein